MKTSKKFTEWVMEQEAFRSKSGIYRSAIQVLALAVEVIILLLCMTYEVIHAGISIFIPPHEKSLKNEVILVTGSGHGIGRELVLKLAAEGAKVIGWDRSREANEETYSILKERGLETKSKFYVCDVTNRDEVFRVASKTETECGDVTILVNNAGILVSKSMKNQTQDDITRVFQVNVLGYYWTLQAFLPKMRAKNSGHIVATCSMCGVIGIGNAVPYCSSKFAVRGMMESLYEELRMDESTNNIKLTTIYPIMVGTGLAKRPRNRFPSLFDVLDPEETAVEMVKAIKRESYEVAMPPFMLTFDRVTRVMPRKMVMLAKDFLDTGVDPE